MSSLAPKKHKITNWPASRAIDGAIEPNGERGVEAGRVVDGLVRSRYGVVTAPRTGRGGPQPSFSHAAIHTCLTLKGLFGILLRQTTGFAQRLLCLVGLDWAGLDWAVPDFGTLCRRQRLFDVARLPARGCLAKTAGAAPRAEMPRTRCVCEIGSGIVKKP